MLKGVDNKWRTMANEKLYASKMLIGALYRSELAMGLKKLGYETEKTHADGRFEIAGVSREVIEAFSTRRAEIQAAMNERGLGDPGANPRLAERAALMTRSHKREMDREALGDSWQRQAADLGFDAHALKAEAAQREPAKENSQAPGTASGETRKPEKPPAERAVAWAVDHLAEREAVFSRNDLLAAALASEPGAVPIEDILRVVDDFQKAGTLHAANLPTPGESFTTDTAIADEKETIALMHEGRGRGAMAMRGRAVDKALRKGPLTVGQKAAVKLILSETDRVVGVQGYAGTGKTRMLNRTRALLEKRGFRVKGLAPSASAAQTLAAESAIESETLQRFLARNAGVAAGRLTAKGERDMRAAFKKTVLVVDEGSLASTVQTRDLLRIARELRLPRVVLVGDGKQLDAVDAGKPFVQLQQSGTVHVQLAFEALEKALGVAAAAAGRVEEHHAGRIRPGPGSLIAGQRPQVPRLGLAPARVQHRRPGLVHEQMIGLLQMPGEPIHHRSEVKRRLAHPAGERGAIQFHPRTGVDLRLAIER